MKKLVLFLTLLTTTTYAGDIFRIEIGKDYNKYNDQDLRRRVWELERAVFQLQQKVFQLEMSGSAVKAEPVSTWVCKTEAMGEKFSATGPSKAVAENAVMDKCKASPRSANGFHCDEASCSQ